VQFDATGMGAFNGVYSFNFGDERGQSWAISGLSKNTQTGGPIAAHVYDLPGTYTVTVGGSTLTVTVQNPDTVFAGTNTICVSTSATYTGCPTGAATQTTLPSAYAGKRVLLRRGESFGTIAPRNIDAGFQVGAYGTGAKPIVGGVRAQVGTSTAPWVNDWTVMDLNIGSGAVYVEPTTSRFLLYRNDITTPGSTTGMVDMGSTAVYYYDNGVAAVRSALHWPKEVFIVENYIRGVVQDNARPNIVIMGMYRKSVIMGNDADRADEHTMRLFLAADMFIGHNFFGGTHFSGGGVGIRHATKIHSSGLDPITELLSGTRSPASARVVFANNVVGTASFPGSWMVTLQPMNDTSVQGVEDFIAENNRFYRGPNSSADLTMGGRRMTARGNTLAVGGGNANVSTNFQNDAMPTSWKGPYY
jgi:hypothetical protein